MTIQGGVHNPQGGYPQLRFLLWDPSGHPGHFGHPNDVVMEVHLLQKFAGLNLTLGVALDAFP